MTMPRAALAPAALMMFVLVSGFLAQAGWAGWATGLWPWPTGPLSYVFIASILAATAVPVLWIALTGEAAANRAGALDLTVMYGGMFIYVLTVAGHGVSLGCGPTRWPSGSPPPDRLARSSSHGGSWAIRGRRPNRCACPSASSPQS